MKNRRFFAGIPGLLLVLTLILYGCPNPTDGTPKGQEQPETPDPVDPAFWFGEIHAALIGRIGPVTSEEYTEDMEQIADCQYVCDAIAKRGTSYVPVSGPAAQAANCEYLLKMIDKANSDATSYRTSAYATKQAIDKTAVDTAVQTLWKPAGKFVAVASGGTKAAYSTDGFSWTEATLPSSANWYGVAYGNGKFVTVAYYSDKAAYSTDGITWAAATLPSSNYWYGIAYGNGKFVAVAIGSDKAAYSTDGITWAEATLPSCANWYGVAYGNGKFVAIAVSTDQAAYSTDGITWTAATMPSKANWYGVAYGGE
jgi:hypothetical protein